MMLGSIRIMYLTNRKKMKMKKKSKDILQKKIFGL